MNLDPHITDVLAKPEAHLKTAPASYPLPRCASGVPYWRLNMFLNFALPGWREWQARKDMDAIIPVIDRAMMAVAA